MESLKLQNLPSVVDIEIECEQGQRLPYFYLGSHVYFDVGSLREPRSLMSVRKYLLQHARPAVRQVLAFGRTAIWTLVGPEVWPRRSSTELWIGACEAEGGAARMDR